MFPERWCWHAASVALQNAKCSGQSRSWNNVLLSTWNFGLQTALLQLSSTLHVHISPGPYWESVCLTFQRATQQSRWQHIIHHFHKGRRLRSSHGSMSAAEGKDVQLVFIVLIIQCSFSPWLLVVLSALVWNENKGINQVWILLRSMFTSPCVSLVPAWRWICG